MQLTTHSKVLYGESIFEIWKQSARSYYLRRYDKVYRAIMKIKCPKNSFYLKEYKAKKRENLIWHSYKIYIISWIILTIIS